MRKEKREKERRRRSGRGKRKGMVNNNDFRKDPCKSLEITYANVPKQEKKKRDIRFGKNFNHQ